MGGKTIEKEAIERALVPVPAKRAAQREKKVRQQFWSKFKSFATQLPFAEDVAAAYFCATDKNTPLKVRGTLFAALAYFIMPIDAVPDIFAVIGLTDDITVLTAAFAMVSKHIKDEHREQARDAIEKGKNP